MNLACVTAEPAELAAKLDELTGRPRFGRTALTAPERDALAAYRALEQGRQLISLEATIAAGGLGNEGLPRLAIGPLRAETVECQRDGGGCWFRASTRNGRHWWGKRLDVFPQGHVRGEAAIPRPPSALGARAHHLVLFEASWRSLPDPDPALLEHLAGDLYVVVGTWDLTEVERRALSSNVAAWRT